MIRDQGIIRKKMLQHFKIISIELELYAPDRRGN